jgi:signal transduction histidine kinase/ActR/RegA family two-component response regulator
MRFANSGSINKNVALLIILATLPALAILLYTGMEHRHMAVETAQKDARLLTHTMAEIQDDTTRDVQQVLSTIALFPEVRSINVKACEKIFRAFLVQNPIYSNIALVGIDGEVLASGLPAGVANLSDRKHFREALQTGKFAPGEYITTRVGASIPAFPFAYPVLDPGGKPLVILTTVINLSLFTRMYHPSALPDGSFIAITDHQGLRLLYYPPQATNPIGGPIKSNSFALARQGEKTGMFVGQGSDGVRRIFAFEQIRLTPETRPYMYIWAGIPESHILTAASAGLIRNLLLMLLATGISLFISWQVAKRTLIAPITRLVAATLELSRGNFNIIEKQTYEPGEVGTLAKAFHDMAAELRVSQGALQKNEARFRLLLNSLDALVYVSDMKTHEILFINDYGKSIFGDITGKICWQNVQKGQSEPCPFCTNKYLVDAEGKPLGVHSWEHQNTLSGQTFHVNDRAIKWIDGRIVRLEIATDVTDQKRAEGQLRQRYKMEAIGVMAGGIAHNFNNNLAIILGNIELSLNKIPQDNAAIRLLNNAKIAISRSRTLVQQILTYSGSGSVLKHPVDLGLIVEETLELLRATIPSSVAIRQIISTDSRALTINADPSQIQEALVNLCNNAVYAMLDKGEIQILLEPVELQAADIPAAHQLPPGFYARLRVQDDGSGMTDEILDKAFDPFFTTKAVNEGTGMGLSTVQGIMEKHAGWIQVASVPGQGTTFELYFPVVEPLPQPELATVAEIPAGHERLIFLDDNEMLANVWGSTLTECGYQVTIETSSRRVLELFRADPSRYDLLITDQIMPELTGTELITEIRSIRPELPTILCTGYSRLVNEEQAKELGVAVFLMKPLLLPELARAIRQALETGGTKA